MADVVEKSEILKEIIRTITPRGITRKLLRTLKMRGSSMTMAKRADTIAAFVPERGEIPVRSPLGTDKILVIPYKIGERRFLSHEEIEDAGIDIVKEELIDMNNAIAKKEDQDFINCLLIAANNTIFFNQFESTPNFPDDNWADPSTPFDHDSMEMCIRERPILDDIMQAMKFIEKAGGTPDYLIINPREAEDLRRRDELKLQLKTFGLNVIVTNLIDEYFAVIFDSKNAARFVERRPPTVGISQDFEKGAVEIALTERINIVCVNGDMIVRIQRME